MNLELNRAERNVAGHSGLVNSLGSQFQAARLDEDLSHPAIQVIDRAYAPEARAWPPREAYNGAAVGFAAFGALLVVVLKLVIRRIIENPIRRVSLRRLRRAF